MYKDLQKRREWFKRYRQTPKYKEVHKETSKRHRKEQRIKVFNWYGNKCKCCGENQFEFLTIDHINNDGGSHRKEIKKTGSRMYLWIIKNNFPDIFQTLCYNCNCAKHWNNGVCPHKKQKG